MNQSPQVLLGMEPTLLRLACRVVAPHPPCHRPLLWRRTDKSRCTPCVGRAMADDQRGATVERTKTTRSVQTPSALCGLALYHQHACRYSQSQCCLTAPARSVSTTQTSDACSSQTHGPLCRQCHTAQHSTPQCVRVGARGEANVAGAKNAHQ